jgi:choline dehydrogenase
VVDAPGVGENLHDRYEVSVVTELDEDYPIFDGSTLDLTPDDEPDHLMSEWNASQEGPFSTNGSLAALVARSSAAETDEHDVILFSLPIDFRGYYPGYSTDGIMAHNRLSILVLKGYTRNRAGSVRLRSADPRDVPEIRFRYFDEGSAGWEHDLDGVVDGIEIARRIVASLEVARPVRELVPGDDLTGRDQLREFVAREAWGHHACGTARIGAAGDPGAVLDGDFRVRGVRGLRVVDASVFPDIPGFFIASAVYMVSEKAADVLIAEHRRQRPSASPAWPPTDQRSP